MADNSDNEGGINATDFAADVSLRLPLGELGGRQHFGAAIANKRFILEIAQMLKTIGDLDVEVEQPKPEESRKLKRHISVKEYFRSASLTKVLHTLDIALRWLERSSKKCTNDETKGQNSDTSQQLTPVDQTDAGATVGGNQQPNPDEYQKKENVLRGLIYVIGFGDYEFYAALLQRCSKCLDLPENPYNAKRNHIKECLKDVEEKKQKLSELVEMSCDLLEEIIKEPQFNRRKAAQFNRTVRQANVLIELSRDMLSEVEMTMNELTTNVSTITWLSRCLRSIGFGFTCYGIYHMRPSTSTLDSLARYMPATGVTLVRKFFLNRGLKYASFAALCTVAGVGWLSLYPTRAYAFRDDLEELRLEYKRFCKALHGLEKQLKIAKEDFIVESQSRGDNV